MELKFVETIEGKEWEAEFEAPSDFNLHLERVKGGSLVVSQRGTTSGEYASAFAKGMYEGQAVIDYDFGALVYPKYIKVVSGSEVVSASVNFNEGGGSGSGSSDGIEYTYLDLRDYNLGENDNIYLLNLLLNGSLLYLPQTDNNPPGVFPYGLISFYDADVTNALGVAIDESMTITMPGSETLITVKEMIISAITEEKYNAIPRITKEQFYNLEA